MPWTPKTDFPILTKRIPTWPWADPAQRHVVKIFLVDDALRVRNVYSSGFLDADLVLADVATVTSVAGRK